MTCFAFCQFSIFDKISFFGTIFKVSFFTSSEAGEDQILMGIPSNRPVKMLNKEDKGMDWQQEETNGKLKHIDCKILCI
jgi:hypothetical protein